MCKVATNQLPFNSLPLWQAAQQREYRALSYPAKKLAMRFGLSHSEARLLAQLSGLKGDE